MTDWSKLFLLAPLALASASLALLESRRTVPPAPSSPGPIETLAPPAILLALSSTGNWNVVAQDSVLQLSQDGLQTDRARVGGSVSIGSDGDLARLDLLAQLEPEDARALLGSEARGGTLELHAEPAPSSAAAVPGVRRADLHAQLKLGALWREIQLRAYWIPCGPGRLRLQLAGGWDDQASISGLFAAFATDPQRSRLALDLALARS